MSNIILREDFLVKKILLSKSEIRQERDLAKKKKLFEYQDKLVGYLSGLLEYIVFRESDQSRSN